MLYRLRSSWLQGIRSGEGLSMWGHLLVPHIYNYHLTQPLAPPPHPLAPPPHPLALPSSISCQMAEHAAGAQDYDEAVRFYREALLHNDNHSKVSPPWFMRAGCVVVSSDGVWLCEQ